jgi:ABC-type multidrug transport system ATPase subunit
MEGRTSFVIAQRIATVLNADQILVLEKGQVVARGTHEELMARSEIYADIYHSQLIQDTDLSAEPAVPEAVPARAGAPRRPRASDIGQRGARGREEGPPPMGRRPPVPSQRENE